MTASVLKRRVLDKLAKETRYGYLNKSWRELPKGYLFDRRELVRAVDLALEEVGKEIDVLESECDEKTEKIFRDEVVAIRFVLAEVRKRLSLAAKKEAGKE